MFDPILEAVDFTSVAAAVVVIASLLATGIYVLAAVRMVLSMIRD